MRMVVGTMQKPKGNLPVRIDGAEANGPPIKRVDEEEDDKASP